MLLFYTLYSKISFRSTELAMFEYSTGVFEMFVHD